MGREGVLWGKHSDRTGLSSCESRGGIQESHDGQEQEGRQVSSVSMDGLCTDCSIGSEQNQCWRESMAGGESNGAADREATLDTELTSMKLNTRRPSYH